MSDQWDAARMNRGLWVLALALSGCGPLVMTSKLHPFHLTPPQQDVLWVQRGGDVYRCANTPTGPICLLAPFASASDSQGVLAPPKPVHPKIQTVE